VSSFHVAAKSTESVASDDEESDRSFRAADAALWAAENGGRDRVHAAPPRTSSLVHPHARRGDVFSADAARRFRSIISLTLHQHGISPVDVLADVKEELAEGRASGQRPTVGINARFAWGSGSAMPPEILAALPALPKALEYTFVNRDLLLVDVEADLVVDILPDALQRH
jgi:hypothetical protein